MFQSWIPIQHEHKQLSSSDLKHCSTHLNIQKPPKLYLMTFAAKRFKMRAWWKFRRIVWESQRVALSKEEKHSRPPMRLVTVLSHCLSLIHSHSSAFLFPLALCHGLSSILRSSKWSTFLFFVPVLQTIQEQIRLAGTRLHFKEDICIKQWM